MSPSQSRTRLALYVGTADPVSPSPDDAPGMFNRLGRWLTGRPVRGLTTLARRAGVRPGRLLTSLIVIPDTPQLQARYADDDIPFVIDGTLEPEVLQFIAHCRPLKRADLRKALPWKRPLTLDPSASIPIPIPLPIPVPLGTASWPRPVATCQAYREAHAAQRAYVMEGDQSAAVAFARKWLKASHQPAAVSLGLLLADWTRVELFDEESVLAELDRCVRQASSWEKAVWEHEHRYQRLTTLGQPVADGGQSLGDLAKDRRGSSTEDQYLDEVIAHPCIDVVLASFTEQQRQVVLEYARLLGSGAGRSWHLAALRVGVHDPKPFSDSVRRKVLWFSRKHKQQPDAATCLCRHYQRRDTAQGES
ncbi:hypothetical protein ACFYWP_39880 [Actinacidiphila glaucinigra]|uniref:hypothetical protein n=1 Tax=Actinacidiphila glaucinigra TaxID=235986 RepID=UPI00368BEC2A